MGVLVDSLTFSDMMMAMMLVVTILVLFVYFTNLLIKLLVIDYKASIGTYLFDQCLSGKITVATLNHLVVISGRVSGNYFIVCPRIVVNDSKLNVTIYTAYVR